MKFTTLFPRLLPLALLCGLAPLASAQSNGTAMATVINTVPYTITTSGRYVVGQNLVNTTSGEAITINVANVVLDLNGYFVSNNGNNSYVIYSNNNPGVTIKNGTVANGGIGVYFGNGGLRDELVDGVTVTHCFVAVELDVAAPGSAVTNCVLSSLSGFGMYLSGGVRVENNVIDTVTGAGSYGIYSNSTDLLIGNTISNCANGIYYGSTATGETAGKFLNNLLYNCTTPFTNGVNATGNN